MTPSHKGLEYFMAMTNPLILCIFFASLVMCACAPPDKIPEAAGLQQLKEGAFAGDVESQYQLGMYYTVQNSGDLNLYRAYQWFLTAAGQGYADAQYMVGMDKIVGRGTSYDQSGAIEYFRRAAMQGHARSQYQFGKAYLDGAGVEKDKPWGRQWLEQAAWQEHREAQFLLGALFAKGVGGQPSLPEAWRWLKHAEKNGQKQAKAALKTLEKRLSAQERKAGERLLDQQEKAPPGGLYALPQVRYVQTILNQSGFTAGYEDGLAGPMTRAAVADYVLKNNLPRDTQTLQLAEYLRGNY